MAQVECDAQSHGCGTGDGTIGGILAFPGLHMKKGFRTPPKTLTVEPGIPGVCCYFAVFLGVSRHWVPCYTPCLGRAPVLAFLCPYPVIFRKGHYGCPFGSE